LGGEAREFPETRWSLVARMKDSATMTRREALEGLCRRYWKPVYHYARMAWSKSSEDAKDLTQAFFLSLLEGESLKRYEPSRGSFRNYLKVLLRGFSADQHGAAHALKRGGGARTFALDGGSAPFKDFLEDAQAMTPDQVFDLAWKKEIVDRALERTRDWFASVHRSHQFRAFEEYERPGAEERATYSQVAAKLGISESDVRNHLFAVRERLRSEIRAELSQTVTDLRQLDEEWNDLFTR
jgi:RNA polymerase sigma-70 factor (ECF subfamily)